MRLSFTGVDEYDELLDSVLFGVWIVIAAMAGAYILLSVSTDPAKTATLTFFYSMVLAGCACFVPLMDRTELAEGRKALWWAFLGFGGLLGIAFISNIFTVGMGLVPANELQILPNYLQLSVMGTLGLGFSTLFGTLYFVATGEECLKALGLVLFNLFHPIEELFGFTLPDILAAQPLTWGIVGLWAVAHTILGQNPSWYAIPVFFDGLWIVVCQYKGGSWIAGIIAHFLNNTFFLGLMLLNFV